VIQVTILKNHFAGTGKHFLLKKKLQIKRESTLC